MAVDLRRPLLNHLGVIPGPCPLTRFQVLHLVSPPLPHGPSSPLTPCYYFFFPSSSLRAIHSIFIRYFHVGNAIKGAHSWGLLSWPLGCLEAPPFSLPFCVFCLWRFVPPFSSLHSRILFPRCHNMMKWLKCRRLTGMTIRHAKRRRVAIYARLWPFPNYTDFRA